MLPVPVCVKSLQKLDDEDSRVAQPLPSIINLRIDQDYPLLNRYQAPIYQPVPFCGLTYQDVEYSLVDSQGTLWQKDWLYFDDRTYEVRIEIESFVRAPKTSHEVCILAQLEQS